MPLTPEQIAAATGCPLSHVAEHWPNILAALDEQGINTDAVQIAAAGTVAVETAYTFQPINERGGEAYFNRMYDTGPRAEHLGNTPGADGDGARYHGRGFVQLTGDANYHDFGVKLGLFLEDSPEMTLDPVVAARILALYFKERGIKAPAEAHDWTRVRRMVNGGTNGLQEFLAICGRLS